jgi:multidrug transporter EmrE-like cation transporter
MLGKGEVLMRNARTAWIAVICLMAVGAAFPVLAKGAKSTPLDVTYYYLPG